jgi:hypothetical protein
MVPARRSSSRAILTSILVPGIVLAALACVVTARGEVTSTPEVKMITAPAVAVARTPTPGALTSGQPDRLVVTPRAGGGLAIHPAPDAAAPTQVLPAANELGSPLALLAVDRAGDWLQVLLPTRPNGSTGWVRAGDVMTSVPVNRVEVSFATHELRVIRISDGAVVLTSPAGFGRDATPTPAGEFFVRDHFPTGSANHAYGPFAFGLSGHSDVLYQFGTGDGRLAIHGTDQPSTIGANASNGCVHVPNDVVLALVDLLPIGTPVVIS